VCEEHADVVLEVVDDSAVGVEGLDAVGAGDELVMEWLWEWREKDGVYGDRK
jgi:hypothetical protein